MEEERKAAQQFVSALLKEEQYKARRRHDMKPIRARAKALEQDVLPVLMEGDVLAVDMEDGTFVRLHPPTTTPEGLHSYNVADAIREFAAQPIQTKQMRLNAVQVDDAVRKRAKKDAKSDRAASKAAERRRQSRKRTRTAIEITKRAAPATEHAATAGAGDPGAAAASGTVHHVRSSGAAAMHRNKVSSSGSNGEPPEVSGELRTSKRRRAAGV